MIKTYPDTEGIKSLLRQTVSRPHRDCKVINRNSKGRAANKLHRTSPLWGLCWLEDGDNRPESLVIRRGKLALQRYKLMGDMLPQGE